MWNLGKGRHLTKYQSDLMERDFMCVLCLRFISHVIIFRNGDLAFGSKDGLNSVACFWEYALLHLFMHDAQLADNALIATLMNSHLFD
ncbi:hypothetical protein RIF29_22467 [Crotalaria pallida]|uniref:Uncharacterized protein n=1 Tax=Crotalaria pallida TaxID=3830 RepID=A0AAN9F4E0_CROPI